MPIGNDIIDLDEASKHRPQYYLRLKSSGFAKEEWLLHDLPDGTDGLWLLWSLKESAYKALVQGDWDGRRFNPMDFNVTSLKQHANDFVAEICFKNRAVNATSTLHKHYLYSVTQPENDLRLLSLTFECPSLAYIHQSGEVRKQAISALADAMNIPADALSIRKTEDEVPQFFKNDELLETVDLSLSHHGKYGAYAITCPE